ncbi:hypothetical protein PPERSA_11306 [Pseudocohnilembus persalinus]|uniref:Uncharacterized protein n=1 Tax=Pseudocohnilembus persalinus TaxID=266149 RepID=A0A0V0QPL6_PSEPJ|nr:hypothetical protein PPERSA_11306 [Pseudocohnilembus persalinus]|eukprot:KRX04182.1 hypothetical protein PPERSA_11306 [Pseudocohnilembus persalinus]
MNKLKDLSKLIKSAPAQSLETKAGVTHSINDPIEINPEVIGEKMFLKREKYYQQDGPMLYVQQMLQKKGPLTAKQIWSEFVRDKNKPSENLLQSKNHLKQSVMRKMREDGRIQKVGYDKQRKLFLGWRLNSEKAFKNTHPDFLLQMSPQPDISRMLNPDVIYRKAKLQAEGVLLEDKQSQQ